MTVNCSKTTIKTVQNIKETYKEIECSVKPLPGEFKSAKQLVEKEKPSNTGNKLIKIGALLIVGVPEPFISDIAGTALVATGFAMNRLKKKDTTLDLIRKFQKDMEDLDVFRSKIV